MSLLSRLKRLGGIFFRWRSYIPLILIPLILFKVNASYRTFGNHLVETGYILFCFLISLLGESVRIITVGFAPPGTSGRNTKSLRATVLNTTGMYSITRNPLYLGNYLIIFGITLISRSWELIIINSLLFAIFYIPIILMEEDFLLEKFGDSYRNYLLHVPCFFPKFSLWNSAAHVWSWKRALYGEHNTFFAIILSFTIMEHFLIFVKTARAQINLFWSALCGLGMLIWLTVKLIKSRKA